MAAKATIAHDALSALLSPPRSVALVESLVTKYVALTPEELQEWQEDPEGYIRLVTDRVTSSQCHTMLSADN